MTNLIAKIKDLDLWSLKGVEIDEIIERLPERSDEVCEKAADFVIELTTNPKAIKAMELLPIGIAMWGASTRKIIDKVGVPEMPIMAEVVVLHVEYLVREYLKAKKEDVT